MSLERIKEKTQSCLEKLYRDDSVLFTRNRGEGLCERCIVFRLALYLQEAFCGYFVDCDFNSASENERQVSGKPITDPDGRTSTKRFVDIIVHKRTFQQGSDFICFEVKKWNYRNRDAIEKDKNNLKVLTRGYGYRYGIYLILGKCLKTAKWTIFQNGEIGNPETLVFSEYTGRCS
jgi:hypothetical protein